MSKQSEAKNRQTYEDKPNPRNCSTCQHYTSDKAVESVVFGGTYRIEKNKRCGIGGFAVKKTAVCSEHEYAETNTPP